MSYTALYRKFRPKTFEDVKGQDPIVTTLKNQIKNKRTSHAYLFCGTRGTGKTTIAKIFARAVNCENPVDGSPCGECEMCKGIADGSLMNVIEIDAASNNGVDSIRQIVEEVSYSPAQGAYKVYIIDEVHMLSIGAFNALLKTLEEPPEYVIFILATTEVHKLPITILSRCQRYDFRRIDIQTIADRITELTKIEGVSIEEKAVRYIAKTADGSMRDALSLLDQCMAFYFDRELTYENVLKVLGAVDTSVFSRVLRAVVSGDVALTMKLVDEIVTSGRELTQFVNDMTWYLRNLLLLKTSSGNEDVIDISAENMANLKEEAEMTQYEVIVRYIRNLSDLSNRLRLSGNKRILIEIEFIKLCRPQMETNYESLLDRVRVLEDALANNVPLTRTVSNESTVENEPDEEIIPKEVVAAIPEDIKKIAGRWNDFIGSVPEPDHGYLSECYPSAGDGDTLFVVANNSFVYNRYASSDGTDRLKGLLRSFTGKEVNVFVKNADTPTGGGVYPDIRKYVDSKIDFAIDEIDEDDISEEDYYSDEDYDETERN